MAAKHELNNDAEFRNNKSVTLKLGRPASFLDKLGINEVATARSKSNGVMRFTQSSEVATLSLPDNLGKGIHFG
ncbi:MAG: hypothetical protein HRT53_06930 [Colwellia sp.]|nr:hypothetical protein [Colwellia sp.]